MTAKEDQSPAPNEGWPIRELWEKYEDIAMHFNDLIMRLRTQALGAVAALSTLVGLFAKANLGASGSTWEVAGMVFSGLAVFWVAIWVLDFAYYNQLLIGSVDALLELEKQSAISKTISQIRLSTLVEKAVKERSEIESQLTRKQIFYIIAPRWTFYGLVFVALVVGAILAFYEQDHPLTREIGQSPLGEKILFIRGPLSDPPPGGLTYTG